MIHISRTETLALVRKALREAFPQTSFTLQSSRSKVTDHGCDKAVYVKWTDGPCSEQVLATIVRFEDRLRTPMDREQVAWNNEPKAFHLLDGQAVHFDLSRFTVKRELSDEARIAVMNEAVKEKTPYAVFEYRYFEYRYSTVERNPSATAERVQNVDFDTWERQELHDLAVAAMVANGPAQTRIRARM